MVRPVSVDSRYAIMAYFPFRNLFVSHISVRKPDCKHSHENSYIFAVTIRKMIIRSQLKLGLPVVLLGY